MTQHERFIAAQRTTSKYGFSSAEVKRILQEEAQTRREVSK